MIAVIVANTMKVICILLTFLDRSPDVTTLGDAIESFLVNPDFTTWGIGPLTAQNLPPNLYGIRAFSRIWQKRRRFRGWAASFGYCLLCHCLFVNFPATNHYINSYRCLAVLISAGVTLYFSLEISRSQGKKAGWLGDQGGQSPLLGNLCRNVVGNSLNANLPQLVLRQLYLLYNNLFTRKEVCKEWSNFGSRPQVLRVTHARGGQKTAYYFGLPQTFAIPL